MQKGMVGRERLWEIAVDQHGYVTAAQAYEQGLSQPAVAMLALRGRLEHAAHGVYRIPEVPLSGYEPYMLAVLWTGAEEACLSHDTALAAYDISDINPNKTHVTVAKRRRIRRAGGDGYAVHYQDLLPPQIGWWNEVPTVTAPVAVEQCIRSGVAHYLITQALERGRDLGRLSTDDQARLHGLLEERDAQP